jgi:hypothetical protein
MSIKYGLHELYTESCTLSCLYGTICPLIPLWLFFICGEMHSGWGLFLTPWSRAHRGKSEEFQLVKKFPNFIEPGGALPRSHEPSTFPIFCCMNPVHAFPSYFFKFHFNIVVLSFHSFVVQVIVFL